MQKVHGMTSWDRIGVRAQHRSTLRAMKSGLRVIIENSRSELCAAWMRKCGRVKIDSFCVVVIRRTSRISLDKVRGRSRRKNGKRAAKVVGLVIWVWKNCGKETANFS